ncbi:MAG: hypothetical protein ABIP46_11550 [Polaromonas sp.]
MFRPLHFPHRLTDRFHHRLPHRFTWGHALGVMAVALAAMLACGSVWAQAGSASSSTSGVSRGSAFRPVAPAVPIAPGISATPAPINSGDAAPMGTYPGNPAGSVAPTSLPPTLGNPINRNPATRAAIAAPPVSASLGSSTLASPSAQGFASPPASRDTLVAPDPSRDGAAGAL